jgi:superfamily II DNA/RNA helicase/uncharacterized protein YoxC
MTARSQSDIPASGSDRIQGGSSNDFFGSTAAASTPKLVVDEPESTDSMLSAGQTGSDMSNNVDRSSSINFDSTAASAATSPTAEASSTPFNNTGQFGNVSFADLSLGGSTATMKRAAPQPLRSDFLNATTHSTATFKQPYGNLAGAAASTSSLNQNPTLLSPSAAANVFASPLSSTSGLPPHGGGGLPFFLAQNAGRPTSPSANAAMMQSFASLTDRSGVASPSFDVFQPMMANSSGSLTSDIDTQLATSRIMQECVNRLVKVEASVKDFHRSVSGLNRNVSILLDRTKHMAGPLGSHGQRANSTGSSLVQANTAEEIRSLSAQVAHLTSSMSQLLGQNGQGSASVTAMPGANTALAGLGLAGSTPQLGGGSTISTPQLGTFPGTPAYHNGSRFGAMGNAPTPNASMQDSAFRTSTPNLGAGPHDRNSRLSPRPGASPGPQSNRRWNSMVPGTPDVSQATANGAMNPPDPSVIVTKWEHLNLHADLLRSILKYGLGPPNKIQQRALPFLLRGSDIIAQAPPTQERIASYIIPVLQLVLNVTRGEANLPPNMGVRGPITLIISTTVDQATQAQRMAMGLGAALGVRVHIAAASSLDVAQEASALIQTQAQIVVGTPQKMMDMFNFLANNTKGAVSLADVRCVVLDEVDQLIARNLSDHVSALLRILPTPRVVQYVNPAAAAAAQRSGAFGVLSPSLAATNDAAAVNVTTTDRQTAIFSNTVPQDVLNFAQSIHLRESVRVLVRREGGAVMGGGVNGAGSMSTGVQQAAGGSNGMSVGPSAGLQAGTGSSFTPSTGLGSAVQESQQTLNTLGASPANNHANPMSDPILSSLRGLRQYYLYVAVTTGSHTPNSHGSQIAHAMEMKLDVITDLLEDIDFGHAVVYTASSAAHEAVTYKLASKGIEALGLHRDMASTTRQQVLAKYRSSSTQSTNSYHAAGHAIVGGVHAGGNADEATANAALLNTSRPVTKKALVVHDVIISPKDVHQVPLILFYDLPRNVDEYKEKIACAASGGPNARPSVCVNVVTGSGGPRGDIEMLRTLECHLGCKMAELPMNSSQILQF